MRGINSKRKTKIIGSLVHYRKKFLNRDPEAFENSVTRHSYSLEKEFQNNSNWNRSKVQEIAEKLSLKVS